jgi:hypothetical protein
MKNLILFFIFSIVSVSGYSQSIRLQGQVYDTSLKKPIINASVLLVNASDSIITRFTRSDDQGNFMLTCQVSGRFIILVNYPSYATLVDTLSIGQLNGSIKNLGVFKMSNEVHVLEEVIVRQQLHAIRLKGDTTEFLADSFYVKPGENVEELLKKLPGFKIDKNGGVTAQGRRVKHVFVDGEEFFGDDPTLVTQNLRADMVDKVQLYEKKSDQASFTGIDDGRREKTVNIKLKKDKNAGYFGKLDQGIGNEGFYKSQSMINSFTSVRKASAYMNFGNTGVTGLGSQDQTKYGVSNDDGFIGDDGIYYVSRSSGDGLDTWDGKYDGKGLPTTFSGGLHYNTKSADDGFKINGNYKIGSLKTTNETNSLYQYDLPNGSYANRSKELSDNSLLKNNISLSSDYVLDSLSSLRFTATGTVSRKTENLLSNTETITGAQNILVNSNGRILSVVSNEGFIAGAQIYKKKFITPRRTFSIGLNETFRENKSTGLLGSENKFYNISGIVDSVSDVKQNKENYVNSLFLNAKLVYTEPISRNSTLSFNLLTAYNKEISNRTSINKHFGTGNDKVDSNGTSNYDFTRIITRTGMSYNYKTKKVHFQTGADLGGIYFDQHSTDSVPVQKKKYLLAYPQTNLSYLFSTQESVTFTYTGFPQLPTVQQLQPAEVNIDPLNIVKGNPALDPAFDHLISGLYINYKESTSETFFVNAGYHFVNNPIIQVSSINKDGVNNYTYSNINGNNYYFDLTGRVLYRKIFKKTPYAVDLNATMVDSRRTNLSNGSSNIIQSQAYSFAPTLYFSKEKKIDFDLTPQAQYNVFSSSLDKQDQDFFWSYKFSTTITYDAIKTFRIQTDLAFNLKKQSASFDGDVRYTVWNLSVRKLMYKNALYLKFSANDILNQNLGNERFAAPNGVAQVNYQTIKRYFLLSLIWSFQQKK